MLTRLTFALTALWLLVSATAASAGAKPFVAILADARGTVATDLMTPYAILAESGAIDVRVVAAKTDPVRLLPGFAWVKPQMTIADLEVDRPDVIIVPALSVEDDPVRNQWLRTQIAKGVKVVSICNGARVLAAAGVLEGREATVHWFSQNKMRKRYPKTKWRHDVRWITDGPVTTTTGISAGEPATLDLLSRLAGPAVMRSTATRLALPLPDRRHDGADYRLTMKGMLLTVRNRVAFWNHEKIALPLTPGFDELAFGTALDAWSRTYRSVAWATGSATTTSRHGLTVYRAQATPARFDRTVSLPRPDAMRRTFEHIREVYGEPTARFVALQFEHPYGAVSRW